MGKVLEARAKSRTSAAAVAATLGIDRFRAEVLPGDKAAEVGRLNPVIAGAGMALSSVSVVTNSLLLKKWKSLKP